ncbi:3258_t:CDS:2, partial [Racocetra persica]
TSPEVSDAEEMPIAIPFEEQDHISESPGKKLLVPVLPWISDEGNRIRNLADEVIKRTRIEKMQLLVPVKPKTLPTWACNQADSSEYYENFDEIYNNDE